jgi:uncharacterized membrane protein HdeD (DUF308 family)
MEESNTKTKEVPKYAIVLWILYLLASLSILENYSYVIGTLMVICGVLMAIYAYKKDKTGVHESWKITNMSADDVVFKYMLPFLFKYWKFVLSVFLLTGIIGYFIADLSISSI